MARAARDLGHEYIVLTDHSPSFGVARGLVPRGSTSRRVEIARVNGELTPFRVLHGTELEIRADATLDYPDELLARFDVVIASIHTGRNQSSEQLTRRALAADRASARRHPRPSDGPNREPSRPAADRLAARLRGGGAHGTALEINGSPRLDLDDSLARAAAGARGAPDGRLRRTPHRGARPAALRRRCRAPGVAECRSAARDADRGRAAGAAADDRPHLRRSAPPRDPAAHRPSRRGRSSRSSRRSSPPSAGSPIEPVVLAITIAAQLALGGLAAATSSVRRGPSSASRAMRCPRSPA